MNTRTISKKSTKKAPKRRRKLPGLYAGNDRRDEKYLDFLYSGDQRLKVYVYEAVDDWPVPPFLFDCYPFPELEDRIRDEYGAGDYADHDPPGRRDHAFFCDPRDRRAAELAAAWVVLGLWAVHQKAPAQPN